MAKTPTTPPSTAACGRPSSGPAHRWLVIAATLIAFAASLAGLALGVQKQFFPAASRPELLVDLWLPNGSSLKATEAQAGRSKRCSPSRKWQAIDQVLTPATSATAARASTCRSTSNCSTTASPSSSSPRTTSPRARISSAASSSRFADAGGEWSGLRTRVLRLENGPPVGFPVLFRVSGEDLGELRRVAEEVAAVMRANPHLKEVNFDWNEMGKVVRIDIDQDRARALGISSQELSAFLNSMLNGVAVTQMREATS
jgi:multidrug efflux pump